MPRTYKPVPRKWAACKECGRMFLNRSGRQVYCGNTCKVAAYRQRKREIAL